ASARSLEHLVRQEQECRGERDPEGLGGLEVEDQLELRGLLHGQINGRSAFEDFVHVRGSTSMESLEARPIEHEATVLHVLTEFRHDWEPALGRQLENPGAVGVNEKIPPHDEYANTRAGGGGEGGLQLLGTAHLQGVQLYPQ